MGRTARQGLPVPTAQPCLLLLQSWISPSNKAPHPSHALYSHSALLGSPFQPEQHKSFPHQCSDVFFSSQNNRIARDGKDLKEPLVPALCPGDLIALRTNRDLWPSLSFHHHHLSNSVEGRTSFMASTHFLKLWNNWKILLKKYHTKYWCEIKFMEVSQS